MGSHPFTQLINSPRSNLLKCKGLLQTRLESFHFLMYRCRPQLSKLRKLPGSQCALSPKVLHMRAVQRSSLRIPLKNSAPADLTLLLTTALHAYTTHALQTSLRFMCESYFLQGLQLFKGRKGYFSQIPLSNPPVSSTLLGRDRICSTVFGLQILPA